MINGEQNVKDQFVNYYIDRNLNIKIHPFATLQEYFSKKCIY